MRYYSPTGFVLLCVMCTARIIKILSSRRYRAYSSLALLLILIGGMYGAGFIGKGKVEAKTTSGTSTNGTLDGVESYYFDNTKEVVYFKIDGGYTIQAGSFMQPEKAEKCADEKRNALMTRMPFDAKPDVRIEEIINNNGMFYRVRIGKFASLEEARSFSEKMR